MKTCKTCWFSISFVQMLLVALASVTNLAASNNGPYASCPDKIRNASTTTLYQRTAHAWRQQLVADFYDIGMPPNFPLETNVSVSIFPGDISRVDEVCQTVQMRNVVVLNWHDDRLAYQHRNICAFPYQKQLTVRMFTDQETTDSNTIWIPRLQVQHRREVAAPYHLSIWSLLVQSNGAVSLFGSFNEERTCTIKTARYPFDVQVCPLSITTYNNVTLRHAAGRDEAVIASTTQFALEEPIYFETSEWRIYANAEQIKNTLTNATVKKDESNTSTITYPVYLNRRYGQHVIDWIVSPVVLSVSSVVGMYRGCNVGERFGFGGTIVVANTLMVNELRSVIGVGSDGYPILGQLYLGLEFTLILATLLSGLPHRLASRIPIAEERRNKKLLSVSKRFGSVNDAVGEASERKNESIAVDEEQASAEAAIGWDGNAYDWAFMWSILALQVMVVTYVTIRWIA